MEKFIIDTDPGIDDAQAILMASAHPNAEIAALTVVGGNVGLEHTLRNTLTLVEVIEQDIPVYAGCGHPLVWPGEDAAFVHGADGLGDAGLRPQRRQAEAEHAALAIVRMVNENPGECTLVALGPLTNIAVALHLDPDLPHKIKRFVDMGGAVTGRGNTPNFAAEFNIYVDPEAAMIVFRGWAEAGKVIEVVDWEATIRHGVEASVVEQWLNLNTPRARFFDQITAKSRASSRQRYGHDTFYSADALAMAVALEPDCVLRAESHHLSIEVAGKYGRGQTVVDWGDRSGKPVNASIVLDVDPGRFAHFFEQGLR
ncbi:MAG: nucleoside hydrolase [Chloroflexota bacterium]